MRARLAAAGHETAPSYTPEQESEAVRGATNEKGPGCGSGAFLEKAAHPVRALEASALRPSRATCSAPDATARPLQT